MKCVEVYKELYHQEPFDVAFCPYRISPLGAHIDHQYGKINGLAIDKGIHMAYHPKQNGVVELQSLNFPKRAQFFVNAVPEEKQGDWADHLRGAAKMLGEKYRLKVGLSGIIEGSLPIGGLSSSASVIICFLSALCKVNGIHLEPMEMILTAKAAENQYVGVEKVEYKAFVLLQVLSVMLGEQIYVFCSDDKNARNGATNFEDVRCISLVSVFSRLKEESNWTLADAEPYIESLIAFYQDHHQTTFRVMEASEVRRLQRIPCRQVLQEIFDGKFIELKNGMLRYKQ